MCQYCEKIIKNQFGYVELAKSKVRLIGNDNPFLEYSLTFENDSFDGGFSIRSTFYNTEAYTTPIDHSIKIQYCPFCGQKLIRES